jgi:RimJ/RimL family protein N-acetyltransferase
LARLAESLPVRGWSHYLHWYCDCAKWAGGSPDAHVVHIGQDNPRIWEQWQRWPGTVGGPSHHAHFEVSDAFGYVPDGQLVSAAQLSADAADHAWDFGPSTLPAFRCWGFATEVCRAATTFILGRGRVPWYYCDHHNRASARIPAKLGYTTYAEGLFSHAR